MPLVHPALSHSISLPWNRAGRRCAPAPNFVQFLFGWASVSGMLALHWDFFSQHWNGYLAAYKTTEGPQFSIATFITLYCTNLSLFPSSPRTGTCAFSASAKRDQTFVVCTACHVDTAEGERSAIAENRRWRVYCRLTKHVHMGAPACAVSSSQTHS